MPTYIVLLGPPGAGKGTQAQILMQNIGLVHISSGDIFRENIKNGTELGRTAQEYMNKGELVPDNITIEMIRERFSRPDCTNGAILDGFPRTVPQAEALERMLADFDGRVNLVPFITADENVLIERLSGRWTCRAHGHIFHNIFNPPQRHGICDLDGSDLYQRDDDKAETVKRRIQVYQEQTAPLISYYREQGRLVEINGEQPIDQVTKVVAHALEASR
jgi:adenylate kinase